MEPVNGKPEFGSLARAEMKTTPSPGEGRSFLPSGADQQETDGTTVHNDYDSHECWVVGSRGLRKPIRAAAGLPYPGSGGIHVASTKIRENGGVAQSVEFMVSPGGLEPPTN